MFSANANNKVIKQMLCDDTSNRSISLKRILTKNNVNKNHNATLQTGAPVWRIGAIKISIFSKNPSNGSRYR